MPVRVITEPAAVGAERLRMVYETLALLTPYDVPGLEKVRIGEPGDGSYIMADRLHPSQRVLSFGVGPSINFETALAERGHEVLLFDHTVDSLPESHHRFSWFKEGISGVSYPEQSLFTLEEHLRKVPVDEDGMILKMDVEAWEWGVLSTCTPQQLRRFDQIALELHELPKIGDPTYNAIARQALGALVEHFTIFHVHANNFTPPEVVCGLPILEGLEISCIRTDLVTRVPSRTFYPTPLDRPNYHQLPELPLWYFPFLPGSDLPEMARGLNS